MGFQVIEVNLSLEQNNLYEYNRRPITNDGYKIRLASKQDRGAVENIAKKSFMFDRFHNDPKISNSVANEIKRNWARNFFISQRGNAMIVASEDNIPVGFMLLLNGEEKTTIDLIAVDENHRKNGLAMRMIDFTKKKLGTNNLVVGTQVSNIPSIRMYESMGFKTINSQFVLHYHGPFSGFD